MEMIFHSHANKNSFSQERLCTLPYFESEGFRNSEVAYSQFSLSPSPDSGIIRVRRQSDLHFDTHANK